METIKIIIKYILISISYLFIGLWIVIKFILKWVWKGCVWCWEYFILLMQTPTTASGALDRRFKTARLIKEKDRGCGYVIIVGTIIAFIIGYIIVELKPDDTNTKCTGNDTTGIVGKTIVQPEKDTVKHIAEEEDSLRIIDDTIPLIIDGWEVEINSTDASGFRDTLLKEDSITKLKYIDRQLDNLQSIEDEPIE